MAAVRPCRTLGLRRTATTLGPAYVPMKARLGSELSFGVDMNGRTVVVIPSPRRAWLLAIACAMRLVAIAAVNHQGLPAQQIAISNAVAPIATRQARRAARLDMLPRLPTVRMKRAVARFARLGVVPRAAHALDAKQPHGYEARPLCLVDHGGILLGHLLAEVHRSAPSAALTSRRSHSPTVTFSFLAARLTASRIAWGTLKPSGGSSLCPICSRMSRSVLLADPLAPTNSYYAPRPNRRGHVKRMRAA